MKFSKRRQPADFGAVAGLAPASQADAEPVRESLAEAEAQALPPLEPPPAAAQVTTQDARMPAPRPEFQPEPTYGPSTMDELAPPSGWPIWVAAVAVSVLWAIAPIAFAVGYRGGVAPLQNDSFAMAVFALLAIGPAAFVWGAAFMIRQGQKLAFEARRAKTMAEDMLTPAVVAAARAGHVAQAVRDEIARAGATAEDARETLLALRDALALETEKLAGATAQSVRTAQELAGTLGRERSEMGELAHTLDAQATRVADSITLHAKMVADAAGLAETQIREAETALGARAADLAAAAGEASDAARMAGEDLTRHIARLETAGVGVAEQARAVESGLSEQRAALITLAAALRSDHENFSSEAEAHAARLSEFIGQARLSAAEMSDRATKGGEALRQLMADAALQFRDLAETAKAEREEFGLSTLHALEAVSAAAANQRAKLEAQTRAAIDALAAAAEETREAAARHAATAREQVDQLSEAAFTAGQKANQVFEARLEEARALVEQSSRMVEEAGAATSRKLEEGAVAARATLDELSAMLGELEQRASRLPAAARGQAEQVKAAVAHGMDELMEQARRTAEEAQAIDAAFQDRVRRNFEMLSEAVRLMGTVASAPAPLPTPPSRARAAASARADSPPAEAPHADTPAFEILAEPADEEPLELDAPAASEAPPEAPEAPAPGGALAQQLGLRARLKLTPTATDREFTAVFAAAGGRAASPATDDDEAEETPADGDTWTWKDLLASLDGSDGEGERLEAALAAELARMGVDPAKLLPKGRIEEIAAAVQTGDEDGARQVVKKLAPAATRRIARRLFTDDEVKRRTEVYLRRYKTLIDDAVVRDPQGHLMVELLAGEPGRLYLLLDAAAGGML
ncbi:polar localization protein TipN [Phenylobacterium sp. VNQ135]|uniref:polar localization protein TipN n=1 Tax=Phenylobacterium sp. VNQ135 TaxID=3400922 RepID=UPI003BFD930D